MAHTDEDKLQSEFCAQQLKVLGDPWRLRIIGALRTGELTVSDIALLLDAEMVTVSHHLQILKNAGIVTPRRDGRFIYYSLRSDFVCKGSATSQFLDLGCCRIEVPTQ